MRLEHLEGARKRPWRQVDPGNRVAVLGHPPQQSTVAAGDIEDARSRLQRQRLDCRVQVGGGGGYADFEAVMQGVECTKPPGQVIDVDRRIGDLDRRGELKLRQ